DSAGFRHHQRRRKSHCRGLRSHYGVQDARGFVESHVQGFCQNSNPLRLAGCPCYRWRPRWRLYTISQIRKEVALAGSVIEISSLTKRYGDYTAVDNLNLSIARGEIFGLLGPNGAGKSTTILMMLGLTEPTSGSVTVCGVDATRSPIEVKRKVGYLPEDVGFYDDYSGLENLLYTAQLNGMTWEAAEQRARHLLRRVGLADEADKKAGKYSRGMRQRLGLADVLIKSPEVII